jgi:hypothetical protein
MFLQANKKLLAGAVAAVVVWLIVYYGFIQSKWAESSTAALDAAKERERWDELYKGKEEMMPKPDAERAIDESNRKLKDNFQVLKNIEFGNEALLKTYTEATAGAEDHKNYVIKLRTNLVARAKDLGIRLTPPDLGFVSKNSDDPVSVNLIRLAMMDRFFNACSEAGIQNKARIVKISYGNPSAIALPESAADPKADRDANFTDEPAPKPGKKGAAPAAAEKTATLDRLVQFPLMITLEAPEPSIGQMLFEVQRPTDLSHSYFCLRGLRIVVHDTNVSSGTVQAEFMLSALLNEDLAGKLAIQWQKKDKDDRRSSGRSSDDGFGDVPDR